MKKEKVKWGDRRDGTRVKAPGLQTVMTALFPNRTDCEVYLHDTIDATNLIAYLAKKNEGKTEEKMTIGYIKKKQVPLSGIAQKYLEELKTFI
jgi:hypothetical protein